MLLLEEIENDGAVAPCFSRVASAEMTLNMFAAVKPSTPALRLAFVEDLRASSEATRKHFLGRPSLWLAVIAALQMMALMMEAVKSPSVQESRVTLIVGTVHPFPRLMILCFMSFSIARLAETF